MPKLYLHAGTHKTGTSAIQSFAARHRESFLSRGILYPDHRPVRSRPPKAHHDFAHGLAEIPRAKFTLEEVSLLPHTWFGEAVRQNVDVFVSVEALYRHVLGSGSRAEQRRAYLERVADVLNNFDIKVLLVFRRPDNYIRSQYQERTLRDSRPLPSFSKFRRKSENGGLRYHDSVRMFADIFPDVKCLVYEDLTESQKFFTTFFQEISLDVSDLDDVGIVRKSLSVPETRVKNLANAYLKDRREGERFLDWMRTPEIASWIDEAFGGKDFDLWTSHEERKQFLESREEDMSRLREDFFPSRSGLFPSLRREETRAHVPEVPEDLRRRILSYFGESVT